MEPPMVCEKYKMSKIMYNENISWIYLIFGKYFWVLRVRIYFIRPKRMHLEVWGRGGEGGSDIKAKLVERSSG
jgi:hypothetical protein